MTEQAQHGLENDQEGHAVAVNGGDLEDLYPLSRGATALTRINLLQYVWRETLGYLVHPKISADGQIRKVADVATATGIWLCEVGGSGFRANELHGFDISPASFIKPGRLPSNIELRACDASKPPPQELQGRYDFVHVRLLQSMVKDNDPTWIINHCKLLLRPGGYLQWEELDPLAMRMEAGTDHSRPSSLKILIEKLQAQTPVGWISELPKTLEMCDMETLVVERKREPSWHRYTTTALFCMVADEFATSSLERNGPSPVGTALKRMVKDANDEALQGTCASSLFQVVVAIKLASGTRTGQSSE